MILILIKAAAGPVGTAVAGAGRTVTSGAAERTVFRTVRRTLTVENTFSVMITFQRHLAFMRKGSMPFDFLANGRLIFADGLGNSGFCGAINDTGENDTSFIQS